MSQPAPINLDDRDRSGRTLPVVIVTLVVMMVVAVAWGVGRLNNGADPDTAARPAGEAGASARPAPDWFVLRPSSFDLTVVASGELESAQKVEVKSEVEGSTTIIELIDEGRTVKAGQVLAQLADDELRDEIEEADLSVEQARATKIAAEQAFAIAQSEATSKKEADELQVELAQLALELWEKGTDPKKQRDLKVALEKATRELKRAERDLELSVQLEKERFISKNELEDAEIHLLTAKNDLTSAAEAVDEYQKYIRRKEMRQVQSDLSQAKAKLDRTLRTNVSELAKAKADFDAKVRALKIREDRLTKLRDQLDKTTIRAPKDGLVVYATSVGSRRYRGDSSGGPMSEGSTVRYNETIILLPDTRQMVASLKVHESMVRNVRKGQTATLTVDARRGTPITGEVIEKSVLAVDAGWTNPDLREYRVKVKLPPNTDKSLKPGMRCSGQIIIGRVEEALAVPVQAVFTERRSRYCYLAAGDGRVRKQPVKIGRASETRAEVLDGLKEGDRVLLRLPRPGEVIGE